jgi:hypothetical protein
MSVNTPCQEYNENLPLWTLVRDSIAGEEAVKEAAEKYLPRASGHSDTDYRRYLTRVHYAMFTARTAEGLYGQIFSKPPVKNDGLPELFNDFLANVDKAGTGIDQFASDLCWDVIQTCWGGILADHSTVPDGMSRADKERLGLTSFLRWYTAESVINWRYDAVNDRQALTLVVLKENYAVAGEDKFTPVPKTRYRVLELIGGVYTQQTWEKVKDAAGKEEYAPGELLTPLLDGEPLDFIPFFPCPAKAPEKSMLLPIACLNIGHYQLSADYVNILHYTGTPTPYGAGIKPPADKDGKLLPVKIGGTNILFLEGDNDREPRIGYLEPSGTGAAQLLSSLENIKKDMEVMGADLIKGKKKGVETAEAARIHQAGENAVLGSFSLNMGERLTAAIRLGARWRGVPENITDAFTYTLNMDYEGDLTRIDEKNLAMREMDNGVMSKTRYLTETDGMSEEEAQQELEKIRQEGKGSWEPPEQAKEKLAEMGKPDIADVDNFDMDGGE